MKNFYEFNKLNESLSSVVYHFTTSYKLESILETNTLNLTPTISSVEETKGRSYFMSFSRTKSIKHGYGNRFDYDGSVRIKLDGDKLSHNHKGIQFDYWQGSRDAKTRLKHPSHDEMEDRIISNNPYIDKADKFIINIDILKPKSGNQLHISMIDNAKKLGIKLNFFRTEEDFAYGLESKSVELLDYEISRVEKEKKPTRHYNYYKILAIIFYKNEDINREEIYNKLREIEPTSDIEALMKAVDKEIDHLKYHLRDDDFYLSGIRSSGFNDLRFTLDADLSNNKSSADKSTRYIIDIFMKDYRKSGSNSIKDYLLYKVYYGEKRQKDYNKEINDKILKVIDERFINLIDSCLDGSGFSVSEEEDLIKYLNAIKDEMKKVISIYMLNNTDKYKYNFNVTDSISLSQSILNDDIKAMENDLNDYGIDDYYTSNLVRIAISDIADDLYQMIKKSISDMEKII